MGCTRIAKKKSMIDCSLGPRLSSSFSSSTDKLDGSLGPRLKSIISVRKTIYQRVVKTDNEAYL